MSVFTFYNRDLSWLSFNERVLLEAGKENVPLPERIQFLSIYSSNLDEFYRVRMPALMALQKINKAKDDKYSEDVKVLAQVTNVIGNQLYQFGTIFTSLLTLLEKEKICICYNKPVPAGLQPLVTNYFLTQVLAFLQPVYLSEAKPDFSPENNKLYIAVIIEKEGKETYCLVNVPSTQLPRFFPVQEDGNQYIVFLDDIIKDHLHYIFRNEQVVASYNIKITRDAELNLEDDYEGDLAEKIEKKIASRDYGFATRFLYQPGLPLRCLQAIVDVFGLFYASVVEGGMYHNLKDLASLPVKNKLKGYDQWPAIPLPAIEKAGSLLDKIAHKDWVLHTPYHSYGTVLRFFNEAAIDPAVIEIYVTLYRVANDSRIVNALISAARNGKKVTVLVELKARFDEANNIRWARKMKEAGVKILYSVPELKVHAKIALVKKNHLGRIQYFGLLATGNFNESTAAFYTDHILMTAHQGILREMELLFIFLSQRTRKKLSDLLQFEHLLVAQCNLQERFIVLIDREINHAAHGYPASITIKLNNLEEQRLISKLYEASNAGVQVHLLVRSICCLIPGVPGMSEHITITRIVDRYLEHGRVFAFHNNGLTEVYMGSADWMNRNIYRRIEVCFPVYDEAIRKEMLDLLALQVRDNQQAVRLNSSLQNEAITTGEENEPAQQAIYHYLKKKLRYETV